MLIACAANVHGEACGSVVVSIWPSAHDDGCGPVLIVGVAQDAHDGYGPELIDRCDLVPMGVRFSAHGGCGSVLV